ncbi:MAG: SRPBCC family protein [Pseudomonadota bacterium]
MAPHRVARLVGAREHGALVRLLGVRELATGAGILLPRRPGAAWLWARVAGDLMDLGLLARALRPVDGRRRWIAALRGERLQPTERSRTMGAIAAVGGVMLLDVMSAWQLTRSRPQFRRAAGSEHAVDIERSIVVNRPPEECYRFWRDLENLPRFMRHLESVQILDERRSHWVARAPGGRTVEWDSILTVDRPGQLLAWRSVEGADVANAGSVRFEPGTGGRGTLIRVRMQYDPPGGVLGAMAARLFGEEPELQVREDLRRFKQMLEAGEIPTTRGQPSGRRSLMARLTREGRLS